jgi:uncharacterized protein YcgI (DUF1989 family)
MAAACSVGEASIVVHDPGGNTVTAPLDGGVGDFRHVRIPAGRGVALRLKLGDVMTVINTSGTQVVDLWAFVDGSSEHVSMGHCREVLQRLFFQPGDTLITNRYRQALTIVSDTSGGKHDTLIAACSRAMFASMGGGEDHPSCEENLTTSLEAIGVTTHCVPAPWNLFMIAEVDASGHINYKRASTRPGAYVELTAQIPLVVSLSACPDDIYPTNGGDGAPRDAEVRICSAEEGHPV